jgi:uncharacterized protein DUF4394
MPRRLALSVVPALVACMFAAPPAAAQPVLAVAGANLVRFDTATPGTIDSSVGITGLQPAETIVGIDLDNSPSPAPGILYGVGSTSRLYTINATTGAATEVGSGPFTPALSGTKFGVEFSFDGFVRVVSDAEQNLRVSTADGTATADDPHQYQGNDPNFGANPNIVGIAFVGESLLGIDSSLDNLVGMDGDAGEFLETRAPLGIDTGSDVAFDVSPGGRPFAVLSSGGSKLFKIEAAPPPPPPPGPPPAATLVGNVGATITGGMSIPYAASVFQATPAGLAFGNQPLGTLSGSHTFTLRITGGDASDFAFEATGGAHPDDFLVMSDDCMGRHLEPDPTEPDFASCSVRLRFAPSGLGVRSATFQFCEPKGPGCFPMFQVPLGGTGTAGPFGPPGPRGPAGQDRDVLAAALGLDRYRARQRRRFRIRYVSTLPAAVTLDVLRGGRRVSRKRARAKRGRNRIRIRAPRRRGRYTLRLRVKAGNQTSTDRARLQVAP